METEKKHKEFILGSGDATSFYEFVREQLLEVDTTELSDEVSDEVQVEVTPEKVYFWTRIYLRDEDPNVNIGDTVWLEYTPTGERLETKFIAYGKKGLERDHEDEVTNYNPEDDTKILCLMIDEKDVNESEGIPFLRTLFKLGRHYEYQLVKRNELIFVRKDGGIIDYYDCDF